SNGVIATPRDAYVADIASSENRGASYGVMMTGKCIGCIIGPFFVSFLMFFTEDYRMLLWFGFAPCILAIFILWRYMHDKEPTHSPTTSKNVTHSPESSTKLSWKDIRLLPFGYWTLLLTSALFMLARFSDGLLALQLKALGAPTFICVATIGIFNAISALCCYPIGWLSDRLQRSTVLYFSYITLLLCNLCFILASNMWLGLLGVIFWGAQRGSSQILFTAIIADEAPKKIIGTAIGLFYIVIGITSLVAGAVAGWLAETNLGSAFIFGSIVSAIATFSLMLRNKLSQDKLNPQDQFISEAIEPYRQTS
ncbi:MAG TPA: MFS transporter, partial [Candidatus Nitrosotenuis sp.]|nr:MFS transporter [Candidatus Nitrosotenuis sp.]